VHWLWFDLEVHHQTVCRAFIPVAGSVDLEDIIAPPQRSAVECDAWITMELTEMPPQVNSTTEY